MHAKFGANLKDGQKFGFVINNYSLIPFVNYMFKAFFVLKVADNHYHFGLYFQLTKLRQHKIVESRQLLFRRRLLYTAYLL